MRKRTAFYQANEQAPDEAALEPRGGSAPVWDGQVLVSPPVSNHGTTSRSQVGDEFVLKVRLYRCFRQFIYLSDEMNKWMWSCLLLFPGSAILTEEKRISNRASVLINWSQFIKMRKPSRLIPLDKRLSKSTTAQTCEMYEKKREHNVFVNVSVLSSWNIRNRRISWPLTSSETGETHLNTPTLNNDIC